MCGHVYVKRKDGHPAYKVVLKRYRQQKSRGTSGFGYVAIENNQVVSYQRAETEQEIVALLEKEKAPEIMFHHRQPTGTPNLLELAHPFLIENAVLDHQYLVQHNGVIRNTDDLHESHLKLGFEYSSEMFKAYITRSGEQKIIDVDWNDSESLAVETALVLDGKKARIATEGPAAVIGLQTKGQNIINRFFYRNNLNPLKFHEDKQMITITSAGEGKDVADDDVYRLKPDGGYEVLGTFKSPLAYKRIEAPVIPCSPKKEMRNGKEVTKYWDSDLQKWVEYDIEDTRANTGFLRNMFGLPLPKQPVRAYDDEDVDYGRINELAEDDDRWETESLLFGMSINELWDEHAKFVQHEKDLKVAVKIVDASVRENISNEQLLKRESLQKELDDIDKWIGLILDEVNNRDSLTVEERLSK